jgi:hypothetical protein
MSSALRRCKRAGCKKTAAAVRNSNGRAYSWRTGVPARHAAIASTVSA